MSSFKAFDIAGSGMAAQSVRLNTTASNLANADSVSGDPASVYKPRHPIFEAVRAQLARAGARRQRSPRCACSGIYESTAPAQRALRARQSARRRQRLRVCAGGQRGRGDGQHDLRLALVPEQRRSHEHLQRPAAGHAAARPGLRLEITYARHGHRQRRHGAAKRRPKRPPPPRPPTRPTPRRPSSTRKIS